MKEIDIGKGKVEDLRDEVGEKQNIIKLKNDEI